ncbi:hypothetical protein V6C53_00965 [Desulfocurvibacter africanus]|uniref:hypothetical protein n=1 Tax=Desulfocurvibacter africanus TaxID=873 RepID=UPI002FDA7D68
MPYDELVTLMLFAACFKLRKGKESLKFKLARFTAQHLEQIAFKTPAPALTAQVNCAYAYAAASHADAWLTEHFQKQNALNTSEEYKDE